MSLNLPTPCPWICMLTTKKGGLKAADLQHFQGFLWHWWLGLYIWNFTQLILMGSFWTTTHVMTTQLNFFQDLSEKWSFSEPADSISRDYWIGIIHVKFGINHAINIWETLKTFPGLVPWHLTFIITLITCKFGDTVIRVGGGRIAKFDGNRPKRLQTIGYKEVFKSLLKGMASSWQLDLRIFPVLKILALPMVDGWLCAGKSLILQEK